VEVKANCRILLNVMKTVAVFLLVALLIGSNGCMTYSAVQRAKGKPNRFTGHQPDQSQPGYYALLPVTVAGDIVTSPVQLVGFGCLYLHVAITGDGP
jgi:hypothetical protein